MSSLLEQLIPASPAGTPDVVAKPVTFHRRPGVTAFLEERFLVPAYSSRWAPATIAAHRTLSLPLQLAGSGRRRTVHAEPGHEVLELGREKLTSHITARLFGTLPVPRLEARRWTIRPAQLEMTGADLVVAEVHRWMATRFRRNGWLIVPRSVRWRGDLAMVPPARPSKSLHADLVKLRKQNFTMVKATSPEDWEEFFTTMVAPQAKTRHGSRAWFAPEPFLRKLAGIGTLHFIVENGIRVAGGCAVPNGETVWFALMGVRAGDRGLLQRGAATATLALPIEWARQNNFRYIDLGRTGAFVKNGLQQYKRKWGFVPVVDPLSLVTAVWINSAGVRAAFSREPVLVETERGLEEYAGEAT